MKRLLFSIPCLIFTAVFVSAQAPQLIQTGFSVERELGSTEKHNYEVNLSKGELLNFAVEQRGVDVVLRVYTADGKFYDRVDSPNGAQGEEPFRMVAPDGGRYRIEISRWSENRPAGKYFVKPVEIRKAGSAEIKAALLKRELLKIVAEDNRFESHPDALKRYYMDNALIINPFGYTATTAEMYELMTKQPYKPPAGYSDTVELSDVKIEDLGDAAVMSVYRTRHYQSPAEDIDRTVIQRVGYIFKRVGSQWRIAGVQRTFIGRDPRPVKLDNRRLESFVGVYESGKTAETLNITHEGGALYGKFTGGEKFELIPESENGFYGSINVGFIRGAGGAVTHAVVYFPFPEDRMVIQLKVK